mgnify:FL=1
MHNQTPVVSVCRLHWSTWSQGICFGSCWLCTQWLPSPGTFESWENLVTLWWMLPLLQQKLHFIMVVVTSTTKCEGDNLGSKNRCHAMNHLHRFHLFWCIYLWSFPALDIQHDTHPHCLFQNHSSIWYSTAALHTICLLHQPCTQISTTKYRKWKLSSMDGCMGNSQTTLCHHNCCFEWRNIKTKTQSK